MMREINRAIDKAITESNLTLEEIATQVGCTASYISQLRTKKIPSNPIIRRLAEIFNEDANIWVQLAEEARYNRKYPEEDEKGDKSPLSVGDMDDPFKQLEILLRQIKALPADRIQALPGDTKIKLHKELADLQNRLLVSLA